MECESCGTQIEESETFIVRIEGAKLNACPKCARMGKVLQSPFQPRAQVQSSYSKPLPSLSSMSSEEELAENYGTKMRNARQKMRIPLAVLAEKIAEKESFIDRVEKEKLRPSNEVIKKIEKELGITLLEAPSNMPKEMPNFKNSGSSKGLTLGDILEIEKKKKKK